ncbi:MAG: hypothetical protein M1838_000327 [Thelocarpon superellum]|nr:MAG: hypothetical protein M1838_000327 [Thelocarpon superellum]
MTSPRSAPFNLTQSSFSTVFDPENEACTSTRRLDTEASQQLPQLCDSARKYAPGHVRVPKPDIDVDTFAMARAFPDFTQGAVEDESMSIELGRGARTGSHARAGWHRRDEATTSTGSVRSKVGVFEILTDRSYTATSNKHDPALHTRRNSIPEHRALFERQNVPAPITLAKRGEKGSGSANVRPRPTLTQMHALVAESEPTATSERPPEVHFEPRTNTRFTQPKSHRDTMPVATQAKANANAAYSQSLAEMPNLSELVSGMDADASQASLHRPRTSSRFTPAARTSRLPQPAPIDHAAVRSIPVPGEERDIARSLKFMEEKMERDASERSALLKEMREIKIENSKLRAERAERVRYQRRDSATTDPGSVGSAARRNSLDPLEKEEMESTIRSLHERLDMVAHKTTMSRISARKVQKERDEVAHQLADALEANEDLKEDNLALRAENKIVLEQLERVSTKHQRTAREQQTEIDELKRRILRRTEEVPGVVRDRVRGDGAAAPSRKLDVEQPRPRPIRTTARDSTSVGGARRVPSASQPSRPIPRATRLTSRAVPPDNVTQETTVNEPTQTGQVTELSIIAPETIDQLRERLEEQRRARRVSKDRIDYLFGRKTEDGKPIPTLARAESTRVSDDDHTGRVSIKTAEHTAQLTGSTDSSQEMTRSRSSQSQPAPKRVTIAETGSRRRAVTDVTSAFIIPDITIRDPVAARTAGRRLGLAPPIPVSRRMPTRGAFDEEPTLRPSQPPAEALAAVVRSLEEEHKRLKEELAGAQASYNARDPSLGQQSRKRLHERIGRLLDLVDRKADQIYGLYDVVEGEQGAPLAVAGPGQARGNAGEASWAGQDTGSWAGIA